MADQSRAATPAASSRTFAGHPPGLMTLFFVELWERFSYYGMRALLTLFMVAPLASGGMGFTTAEAAYIYGNYTMAVYMLAIPGGFAADRIFGAKAAVLIGGFIIMCGHFCLAYHWETAFYIGLVLIVVGTGLFKPNVSALVGSLYARGDERRDAGFSIFYMGINIGAFIAPLVTGFLAQSAFFKAQLVSWGFDPAYSWHWGFAAAGIGMFFGLVLLALRRDQLPDDRENRQAIDGNTWLMGAGVIAGTAALLGLVLLSDYEAFEWLRPVFLILPVAAVVWFAATGDLDGQRIAAIFIFFIVAMVFFAIFEQMGLSIALFADKLTDNQVFGQEFPSSWYQSLNPLFIILLAPVFAFAWTRMGSKQPSSPIKFVLGLFFLCTSFLLMVPAAQLTLAGKVSPLWLVGLFLLQTIGELFLSPTGLSTMTKLAPVKLVGLVMGIWFLAAAFGNKIAGILGSTFDESDPTTLADFFLTQAGMVAAVMVLLLILTPWVKKLMGGVR